MKPLVLETEEIRNRRRCERFEASLPIAVQAVNDALQPIGDSFDAFTLDLSQSGARFFNDKPIHSRYAVVHFETANGAKMRLQCEIIRSKRVGGLFEIAVRFLRKVDATS